MVKLPNKKCSETIIPIRKLDHGFCSQYKNQVTIFPQIVSAETILFWIWPYVLWPLITVDKSAETIQGRKLFKGGNYLRKYGMFLHYYEVERGGIRIRKACVCGGRLSWLCIDDNWCQEWGWYIRRKWGKHRRICGGKSFVETPFTWNRAKNQAVFQAKWHFSRYSFSSSLTFGSDKKRPPRRGSNL